MRGSNTCELVFQDCEVPEENVLGELGKGVNVLMSGLDYERAVLAAGPLGIMQACLDVVMPYVHERKQFGQPIGSIPARCRASSPTCTRRSMPAGPTSTRWRRPATAAQTTRKDAAGAILYAGEKATQDGARRDPDASAATATSTTTRPAGCCATPSSTRSAPAPARSAAWLIGRELFEETK